MKVLMFGWEFPPFMSGGLGTACYGLTKGLVNHGVNVTFVLPKAKGNITDSHVDLIVANRLALERKGVKIHEVSSLLKAYITAEKYDEALYNELKMSSVPAGDIEDVYGKDLYSEVQRYAEKAGIIAKYEDFDVIHAHDWTSYGAGIHAKKISGKPLVVHIHATEFDRTAGNPNQLVYDIEREGFEKADLILAVSEWTRQKVINHYGIAPDKVRVVHNAVEFNGNKFDHETYPLKEDNKIVLFLGRITIQKGPEHFLWVARKVADIMPNVKFVIAGNGDMYDRVISEAANLGLSDKVIFTGFITGKDVDRAYHMADLYIMPSISEPFGITPLESMRNGTPCIISKQSGCSEVLNHCLKADFWDIDKMADQVINVLKYPELYDELKHNGNSEVLKFNWDIPAAKCIDAYYSVMK